MNKNLLSHLALLVVALIYGANYSVAKGLMTSGNITPVGLVFIRIFFGVVVFGVIHALFIKEKVERKDLFRFFLCSMFGIFINQIFFLKGLATTSPIHASLIISLVPLFVLIISGIIGLEKIRSVTILGISVSIFGAFLLILKSNPNSVGQTSSMLGDLYVLINSISFALYFVIGKPLMERYHPITLLKWVFAFGTVAAIVTCTPEVLKTDFNSFSRNDFLSLTYVLVFATFLTYLLNAFALSNLRPTTVSSYINLQPLIAGAISIWLGYDFLTTIMVVAGLMIISGVYLVSRRKKLSSE